MSAETLLLIPGMMCDERLFEQQISHFESNYNVVVADISRADSVDDIARDVLTQVPDGPLSVVGLSMGGIVAMALLHLAPQRVGRLALLDTNHLAELPERQALRRLQIQRAEAGQLREVVIEEMKPSYLASANRDNQPLRELIVAMAEGIGLRGFINQSMALCHRPQRCAQLSAYQGPALVLCGRQDKLCPPARHQQIHRLLSNSTLKVLNGAGHLPTLEQPGKVCRALEHWLKKPLKPLVV